MSGVRRDARRAARAIEPRRDAIEPSAHRASPRARVEGLDALRGVAIVAMIVYHFCFDLRYFGALRADFEHDIRWLGARTLILSSFLLIAGIVLLTAVMHLVRAIGRGHGTLAKHLLVARSDVAE